jgi:hypothetical protein
MHIIDLFEAPLGSYDVVGDFSERGSFQPSDRRIIQSDQTPPKVQHAFRNIPETIDLIFVPLVSKVGDVLALAERIAGIWDHAGAERRLHRKLPPPSTPDAIQMVYTNNEGSNRIPLTPWIMAHRIGHAIAFAEPQVFTNLYHTLRDVLSYVGDALDVRPLDIIYAIGTMKSVRQKRLNNTHEFVFELFSQYMITGSITFNHFSEPLTIETADGPKSRDGLAAEANEMLDKIAAVLTKRFREMLASVKGKVVIL